MSGLVLDGLRVRWEVPAGDARPERHALYLAEAEPVTIRGFHGSPSVGGGKLAAIGLDRVSDVFVAASKAEAGTGVFIGHTNVSETQIVPRNNDVRHAKEEMAEGSVYLADQ